MSQGSVFGLVLFLLFINDLPLFTIGADVNIYADDMTVHAASRYCKKVDNKLQNGAYGVKCWCMSNQFIIIMMNISRSCDENEKHEIEKYKMSRDMTKPTK